MFPEYRDQIEALRTSDRNFSRLYDKHCALDQEVQQLVARKTNELQTDIEQLKKQKLAVKEQIYAMLQNAAPTLALKQYKNYLNQEWRDTVAPTAYRQSAAG